MVGTNAGRGRKEAQPLIINAFWLIIWRVRCQFHWHMNFKQATDELIATVTLEDLAKALGVSVQSVRQARAMEVIASYRSPLPGWEEAAYDLASRYAAKLEKLLYTITH